MPEANTENVKSTSESLLNSKTLTTRLVNQYIQADVLQTTLV